MQIEPTKPPTGMKWRLSIFEVALAHASAERNLRSGFPYCRLSRKTAGSIGMRGGSYCRRPDSGSGWMVAAVCRRLLLANRKWQLYNTWDDPGCRLQGARTVLPGKTPSNTSGNAGDEPQVNMDDAGKLSAPSILGAGCTLRQASGYGGYSARGGSLDGRQDCRTIYCRINRRGLAD